MHFQKPRRPKSYKKLRKDLPLYNLGVFILSPLHLWGHKPFLNFYQFTSSLCMPMFCSWHWTMNEWMWEEINICALYNEKASFLIVLSVELTLLIEELSIYEVMNSTHDGEYSMRTRNADYFQNLCSFVLHVCSHFSGARNFYDGLFSYHHINSFFIINIWMHLHTGFWFYMNEKVYIMKVQSSAVLSWKFLFQFLH